MTEVMETLRQWLTGLPPKHIARCLGLDPKTVRRYLRAAARCGLTPGTDTTALNGERLAAAWRWLRATPAIRGIRRSRNPVRGQLEAH